MTLVAVSLGSNLGDRLAHLHHGAQALSTLPGTVLMGLSKIYETAAVDCPEPFQFLNAAAVLETGLDPQDLLQHLLQIEQQRGRERAYVNAPRPLDLDLLLYGELQIDERNLIVPHPRMAERLFVLTPLAELIPETVYPGTEWTIFQLEQRQRKLNNQEDAVVNRGHVWSIEHGS